MIPNKKLRLVESGGAVQSGEFGISFADSAHIMTILRDTLYSNKELAVIREYSSNAWDAHRDAGKSDVPIKITMPTHLDPTLSIRDFGAGLSPDDVFKIYTQYGASTKRGNDNSVGMLGIGSKSGFAYSDSFTIVSHHGGTKRTYVAVLDKTEKGVINLLHEEPCGDETGVQIQIAIRQDDIEGFKRKAKEFFMYFKPQPDINIELPKPPAIQSDLTHGVIYDIDPENYSCYIQPSERWVAIMGCVPYRINIDQLRDVDINGTIGIPEYLANMSGALYFDIGDVQVSASREELKYSNDTKIALVNKFNLLVEEYVKKVLADIDSQAATPWERRLKAQVLTKLKMFLPKDSDALIAGYVSFKADTVPEGLSIWKGKEAAHTIMIHRNTRILMRDDARSMGGFNLHDYDYVVRKTDPKKTWDNAEDRIKKMCINLGIDGIVTCRLSSLPWSPKYVSNGTMANPKHKQKVFVLDETNDYGSQSNNWRTKEFEPTQDDVYVIISNFKPISVPGLYSMVREDTKLAKWAGIELPAIYGYKATIKKPMAVLEKECVGKPYLVWREEFKKSLIPRIKQHIENWMWSKVAVEMYNYDYYGNTRKSALQKCKKVIGALGKDHIVSKYLVNSLRGKKAIEKTPDQEVLEYALQKLYPQVECIIGKAEAQKMKDEIFNIYQMLSLEAFSIGELWGSDAAKWHSYIKLVDKSLT